MWVYSISASRLALIDALTTKIYHRTKKKQKKQKQTNKQTNKQTEIQKHTHMHIQPYKHAKTDFSLYN